MVLRPEFEWRRQCLLTTGQMAAADAATIASGVPGIDLMEAAGKAVAREIRLRWRPRRTVVLCGPGNNGGDGFVIARLLLEAGWPVSVLHAPQPESLKGDARLAFERWNSVLDGVTAGKATGGDDVARSIVWQADVVAAAELVVDALFGAGLTRPVDGPAAELLHAAAARSREAGVPVVAVDVPSGVDGTTGACSGPVAPADLTVTFFRHKPGHWLMPGRDLCGEVVVRDIGIPDSVLDAIAPQVVLNDPSLWRAALPTPGPGDHKYTRGHVLVLAGRMPGAAVLAARAAARTGAGMVTVGVFEEDREATEPVLQALLPASALRRSFSSVEELVQFRRDRKVQQVIVGPGFGLGPQKQQKIYEILTQYPNCILDADAISLMEGRSNEFYRAIGPETVLTPHGGEFTRLYPPDGEVDRSGKLSRTQALAERSGAVVIHKGSDTVIAAPDGRVAVNGNGVAWLASAGTGDVLAGIVGGLRAQGVPGFEAACAGVWLHAEAARRCGPGLIADDLPDRMPNVMSNVAIQG